MTDLDDLTPSPLEDGSAAASQRREDKTISQLAEESFVASERLKMLGMGNIAMLSYEERKKSAIAYAEAQHEAFRAESALNLAIRDPSRLKHDQPRGLSAAETPNSVEGVNKDPL